ncbi:hemocyte protein-glutamine gamma-glutamyltransferase-like, partial [Argonauta hians]
SVSGVYYYSMNTGNYIGNLGRSYRSTYYISPSHDWNAYARYGRRFGRTIHRRIRHGGSGPRRFTRLERVYERMGPVRPDHESSDEDDDEPTPDCLKVQDIGLKLIKNTKKHHTNDYEITDKVNDRNQKQDPKLVVRRGFSFALQIKFNRPYDKNTDKVSLQFAFGDRPKVVKGSLVRLQLTDTFEDNKWAAVFKSAEENQMLVEIHTPPDLFVGIWRLRVNITMEDGKVVQTAPTEIRMLFNPFNKEDEVFMVNENERKEYVMNESGKIYVGTSKQIYGRTWNYDQFQGCVLDCVLYMLDNSELPLHSRKSPISITRKLTALINSQDDNGVLMGNWSGKYQGGRSPLDWTGSEAIFEEYYKTKQPVKYGQCWVFSGVLTTALRALGIPARSVTNFSSAHDTDVSVTVDQFFNELGEPEPHMNDDSVWNFHVWNEAFMARSDLPDGYGGWQACDSTPQETSDGIYSCGPCPVKAIKLGDVNTKYDAPFIFAEVNADKVTWIKMSDGSYASFVQNGDIGKNISTKAVLSNDRNDVTLDYKCKEGTGAERAAVMRAVSATSLRSDVYKQGPQDMSFEMDVDIDTMMGKDFVVKVKMLNNSNEKRTVTGTIGASSVFYTGVQVNKIKSTKINATVNPSSSMLSELLVTFDEYYNSLVDHCGIHLTAVVFVKETKQHGVLEDDFRLRKPDVILKCPATVCKEKQFSIDVSFDNPMNIALTHCTLSVEGPGLQKPISLPQRDVKPKQTFNASVNLNPKRAGWRTISVCFSSEQLAGLEQQVGVEVKEE